MSRISLPVSVYAMTWDEIDPSWWGFGWGKLWGAPQSWPPSPWRSWCRKATEGNLERNIKRKYSQILSAMLVAEIFTCATHCADISTWTCVWLCQSHDHTTSDLIGANKFSAQPKNIAQVSPCPLPHTGRNRRWGIRARNNKWTSLVPRLSDGKNPVREPGYEATTGHALSDHYCWNGHSKLMSFC